MSATPEDVEANILKTLSAQSASAGSERIERADLGSQIEAHKYLSDLAARKARKRPFLSSVDMSGA